MEKHNLPWSVDVVQVKKARRYWPVYFLLLLFCLCLGSVLITFGLFSPIPPNACNTPSIVTVFDEDIIGELTVSTPNMSTPLGRCTRIEIYSHNQDPFTLQIIDEEDNLYVSVPHFANNSYFHQYAVVELFEHNYTLLALREAQNASIDLSVEATIIYPILPCIDQVATMLRLGYPIIGILLISLSIYSGTRLDLTLKDQ